ncbi:MAG: L,D-transpeptidase family protein, partial [Gammaproteobacteria bacterium]|nr:L,D-transpeptidase family protein [Gammaproteobacteria bacterium]
TREFPIASGRGGSGDKFRRGDNRTPVGVYRIVDFNERSRFELFMRLNYPNVKDAFYGLKNGLISRPEFDAIVAALKQGATPPQNTPLGGAIGIHGIGDVTHEKLRIHDALDWTEGCIALTNADIMALRNYVSVGTRVEIRE